MIGALALALLGGAAPAAAPAAGPCSQGPRSSVTTVAEPSPGPPRLDGPGPRTTLVLRDGSGTVRWSSTWDGAWRCLTSLPSARGHLLGAVGTRGGWRPLVSVVFLPEAGGPAIPSAFDRAGLLALAFLPGPEARRVAFVGGPTSVTGLWVLDVAADRLHRVGAAPAPPPAPAARATCNPSRFGWGSCWADGLVELEPSVLRFEGEDLLVASFGRDGPASRARSRTVRRFPLAR